MQEEDRMVAAQTLGLVDGEQTPPVSNPLSIEYLSKATRHPLMVSGKSLVRFY